jgi:hypothetical protein
MTLQIVLITVLKKGKFIKNNINYINFIETWEHKITEICRVALDSLYTLRLTYCL